MTAYRCFITAVTKPQAYNILTSSFANLVSFLTDASPLVRKFTGKLMETIAEARYEVFFYDNILKDNFPVFVRLIKCEDEQLSSLICIMFEKLATKIGESDGGDSVIQMFMTYVDDLSGVLLDNIFRKTAGSNTDLIDSACKALTQLLLYIYTHDMILVAIEKLALKIEDAMAQGDANRRMFLVEGIFMIIGMGLNKLRSKKMVVNPILLKELFNMVIKCCEKLKTIISEGLYLMTSTGLLLKSNFSVFVETYQDYIAEAIFRSNNNSTIAQAYDNIGQMCRENQGMIRSAFIETTIMPNLFKRIVDSTVSLEDRTSLFQTLGDLMIGDYATLSRELPFIFSKYEEGMKAIIEMMKSDQEVRDLTIQFRSRLMDALICTVHSIFDNQVQITAEKEAMLERTLKMVCEFAVHTTRKEAQPTIVTSSDSRTTSSNSSSSSATS